MTLYAKIASNVTRRHGSTTHHARVRVYNRLAGRDIHCGQFTGMGDTPQEAQGDALRYYREQMRRDDIHDMPEPVDVGKLPRVKFDNEYFR